MKEVVRPTISLDRKSLPEWLKYWSEIGSFMDVIDDSEPTSLPTIIIPKHDISITNPFGGLYPDEDMAEGKVQRIIVGRRTRDASLWTCVEMVGSYPNGGTFFAGIESLPPDQGIRYMIHEEVGFKKIRSHNGNAAAVTGMEIRAGYRFACVPLFISSNTPKHQTYAYPSDFAFLNYQWWYRSANYVQAVTPDILRASYARGANLIKEIRSSLFSKEHQEADALGHL